jgi:hypothetical protein
MHPASLLVTTGVAFPIIVSYFAAARYLGRKDPADSTFGITGKRRISQQIAATRLQWIDAAELKRLVASDPELVVFHLLDDDPGEFRTKPFESEIGVTLPQLEEALPWMPRGTRFAIYQADGITPELAKRLSAITRGRQALLLRGKIPPVSNRLNHRVVSRTCN